MPRKMTKSTPKKQMTNYQAIEKNIYRTGNRYRVRVGEYSAYTTTLKQARIQKKLLRQSWFSETLF